MRIGFLPEGDSPHDLAQGERAEIDRVRTDGPQPRPSLQAAAAGFRDDIRVDEIHLKRHVAARRFGADIDGVGEGVVPERT